MDDEIVAQLKKMGAPDEVIAAARARQPQEDVEVFEDCLFSLETFSAMCTQWRIGGVDGVKVGLDYGPLPFVMRRCGVPPGQRDQVFEDIQLMEIETLLVERERAR